MPTQLHLPIQPVGAREINAVVAVVECDEPVAYFASGGPLVLHRADDLVGRRVAAGQLLALGLVRQDEISAAVHVHRSTLYRQHARSRPTASWVSWTVRAGPTGRIASRPTSASAWRTGSRRACRSARRPSAWA